MKNLIYIGLITLTLSGCTIGNSGEPAKPSTFTETYVGQIQDARYVSGGDSSYYQTTVVVTETGFYPVYYHKVCQKGKKVWLSTRNDGEEFLKVEGQSSLWDLRDW